MITFKNKYDGSLVMSQQTHAQEVTSHFPVARLVTIGHFQSEQSLVVVAQWEEHALSVSLIFRTGKTVNNLQTGVSAQRTTERHNGRSPSQRDLRKLRDDVTDRTRRGRIQ